MQSSPVRSPQHTLPRNGRTTSYQSGTGTLRAPATSPRSSGPRGLSSHMAPPRLLESLSIPHAEQQTVMLAERTGVALPAATFLTEVASSVPGNVRIDGGCSRSREFLQSGLHQASPSQATQQPTRSEELQPQQSSGGPTWALTGAPVHDQDEEVVGAQKQPQHQDLTRSLDGASNTAAGQHRWSNRMAVGPAVESRLTDAVMRGEAGAEDACESPALDLPGPSASLYILSALRDACRVPATVGVAPPFSMGRRVKALPDEQSLPRRKVPAVGR